MDYFTKWPYAVAIRDKSAETLASALYICMVMGFPAVNSSGQGREFVNGIIKQLVEKTKASQRISTTYHPQTNGLVEHYNKTIQCMILKTCSPEQDDWDKNLKEIVFAYRSMVHSTTKMFSFQVMFGRKPIQKESDFLGNTEELSESQIESRKANRKG